MAQLKDRAILVEVKGNPAAAFTHAYEQGKVVHHNHRPHEIKISPLVDYKPNDFTFEDERRPTVPVFISDQLPGRKAQVVFGTSWNG